MKWKPPASAPKCGEQIIADFGSPFGLDLAVWDKHKKAWLTPQLGWNFEVKTGKEYPSYQNEYRATEDLVRWARIEAFE